MYPFLSDADADNWHDFEVGSRREILALLRGISEKKQMIRMLPVGDTDMCVTTILHIDADNDAVLLDRPSDPEETARLMSGRPVSFETTLDNIRIIFGTEVMQLGMHEAVPALKIPLPPSLIRLQRREFYRMATPVGNPVKVFIPMPEEQGGGDAAFQLSDISCGGIAILDNRFVLGDSIGHEYGGCRIDLPEIGPIVTGLQIRNSQEMTLMNNKANRRLGCQFIDISPGAMSAVQRYITKLERERNARMAGLK
ncbi:flagellar brake protein [[Empedobacter] haloabium]|uniref:Flagellar brake protein YcgR n=1 Tax=[Empedobacter] haloabium TaxID=592317 RepID=A0ABZ1UII2_9BURK